MYLEELTRKEKLKFLDLCLHMVMIDGVPTKIEEQLLKTLVYLVGDGIIGEYSFLLGSDFDETIKYFSSSSAKVTNVVYLCLFTISMFENFYNTHEHNFLRKIQEQFSITETKRKVLSGLAFDIKDLFERTKFVTSEQ